MASDEHLNAVSLLHQPQRQPTANVSGGASNQSSPGRFFALGVHAKGPPDGNSEYPRMGTAGPYSRGPVQM